MVVRRVALTLLAVVVAGICVRLGLWQLERLEDRRALNEDIRGGLKGAPVVLGGAPESGAAYRRASATGTYDADHVLVLYGRPLEGRPGDHVLTPLRLVDGSAILVDRGWVPTGARPSTPSGEVQVEGILLPSESTDGVPPSGGQVRRIDLAGIGSVLRYRLAPAYLLARKEEPNISRLPVPAPLPELSEGPHLSYAIQWFAFAGVAVVGSGALLRRERGPAGAPVSKDEE
jgi:cytochrome oxidase assembly protein ShyY1